MTDSERPRAYLDRPHGGNGRFGPSIDTAIRDGQAARMRTDGKTYTEIAAALGYASRGAAHDAVARAMRAARAKPGEELIETEAARLDALYDEALAVLDRDHITVSNGRVVVGDDGQPVLDDGPKLAALRELRAIRESYRKLIGLDSAQKLDLSGGVKYEIVGVAPEDLT
jgi:DNA transposition AAA+ family ATPase